MTKRMSLKNMYVVKLNTEKSKWLYFLLSSIVALGHKKLISLSNDSET